MNISNTFWDEEKKKDLSRHNIHWYPAKFPPFLVRKAIDFAKLNNSKVENVADIFCGCGTTALESRVLGYNFWGCDLNPVATLIAKVKSNEYSPIELSRISELIIEGFSQNKVKTVDYYLNHERLNHWYSKNQISLLYRLKVSIENNTNDDKYRDFFFCAFSNILRGASFWLAKSIKPQLDKNKIPNDVLKSFKKQVKMMINSVYESQIQFKQNLSTNINTENFLNLNFEVPFVDLIVTSPPYATSYEYADLHQLSTIWLGYSDDFRELRKGSIGSTYQTTLDKENISNLSNKASEIYNNLLNYNKSRAKSVAKYFLDIDKTASQSSQMLNSNGLAVFVIGDTCYNSVEILNSEIMIESLNKYKFKNIKKFKRKITGKILTPYRDKNGRFSKNITNKKIYSHEYIITAEK